MKTYQDYLKAVENNGITQFVGKVIEEHKQSKPYKTTQRGTRLLTIS